MASRILSVRLLCSIQKRPPHCPTFPLKPFPVLLSRSFLAHLRSSRLFSGRAASSNAVRKDKSLIEDEAELSDWISDLKTDSIRLGLSSDSEDDSNRRTGGRGTGKLNKGEKFGGGQRNSRSSRGSVKKRGFYSDEDDDEGDLSDDFSSWRERGGRGGSGMSAAQKVSRGTGGFGGKSGRGGKGLDFDFSDEERGSRGGRFSSRSIDGRSATSEKTRGGKRGSDGRDMGFGFSEEETGNERGRGFNSGRRGGGAGTSVGQRHGATGRGGRDLDFDPSEEETESDNDEGFLGFGEDFIAEKEDAKKGDLSGGHAGTVFRSEKSLEGKRDENTVRSSGGDNESYLSQKR